LDQNCLEHFSGSESLEDVSLNFLSFDLWEKN